MPDRLSERLEQETFNVTDKNGKMYAFHVYLIFFGTRISDKERIFSQSTLREVLLKTCQDEF